MAVSSYNEISKKKNKKRNSNQIPCLFGRSDSSVFHSCFHLLLDLLLFPNPPIHFPQNVHQPPHQQSDRNGRKCDRHNFVAGFDIISIYYCNYQFKQLLDVFANLVPGADFHHTLSDCFQQLYDLHFVVSA